MRKIAFLLAIIVAAAMPSLAFAAKKHHHHATASEPADPNADTSRLIHDLFLGK